jgi:urease accessory protein
MPVDDGPNREDPPPAAAPWLLLQLADAAFPSGGFAHSGGIEAAVTIGGAVDPEWLLDAALWQAGWTALPFVGAAARAHADVQALAALDAHHDATLASEVGNRASRALGRSLASAVVRAFDAHEGVRAVVLTARLGTCHHAPVHGALHGALGIAPRDAQIAFLHGAARQALSSAIRLGIVGPLEAQSIQAGRAALLGKILDTCANVDVDDVAQTSPLLEMWGAMHDRLDARMFQS